MNVTTIVFLVLGLVLLVAGAEVLVRGASRLAATIGLSPLVIGLTIVAYGTSSPELAVSVQSALAGQADIALGNVIGSNIFNVLFILGLSSAIAPLVVAQQLVKFDVPIMIGVSFLTHLLAADGKISRFDGILLFLGGVAYTAFLIYQSRQEKDAAVQEEYTREYGNYPASKLFVNIAYIIAGLILLVLGSRWLVEGAIAIAKAIGVSELIIGLTIVAAGTSLPEVATSVIATLRGERDIAVGNVVGSNIFNLLVVLGLASIFAPDGINVPASALRFDIPVMIVVAISCLPIFFTRNVIDRWEGFLFLGYYVAYTTYLILNSTQHASLPVFNLVVVAFVIPITVVTLAVITWRSVRAARR